MLTKGKALLLVLLAVALLAAGVESSAAQSRKRKQPAKTATLPTSTPSPVPDPEPPAVNSAPKKNERPAANGDTGQPVHVKTASADVSYRYEFAQPDFDISKIVIVHDDTGRGTITFTKRMFADTVSDPLQVSERALGRINAAYMALNFIDSNESYQYEKDFSHLGVTTFGLKKGGKQRTAVFNYTANKDARALADEYRKLGNQFIWIFEMSVARENQPLQSPRLLDNLDLLIRRNEISDPAQMVPLLKDISNDERVPLISRNHAQKLVDKIEKKK